MTLLNLACKNKKNDEAVKSKAQLDLLWFQNKSKIDLLQTFKDNPQFYESARQEDEEFKKIQAETETLDVKPINVNPGKEREKIALEVAKLTKRRKDASSTEKEQINERISILKQQATEIPVQSIDQALQEQEIYKVNRGFLQIMWNRVLLEVNIAIREVRFRVFHKKVESMFSPHRILFFADHKKRVLSQIKQKTEDLNKQQSPVIKKAIQKDIEWLREKEELQFTTKGASKPFLLTEDDAFNGIRSIENKKISHQARIKPRSNLLDH